MASKPRRTRICANFEKPAAQLPRRGRGYAVRGERRTQNVPQACEREASLTSGSVPYRDEVSGNGARRGRRGSSASVGRGRGVRGRTPTWGGVQMGRGRNVETEQGVGRGPIQHPASRKPAKREEDRARETDSAESVDSRVERLGRYLSNRLNMDSDSDDEIGGFMLGEDDGAALIDVSSGDCVTDLLPRLPETAVKAHFTSSKTDVAVYCTAESSAGGVGRGEAASAPRSPDFDDASVQFEGAGVQFGDGTGLFEYDCSFDLTVKNHPPVGGGETEKRGVSVGRRVELVSEDDGWNSEDSDFCSSFPSHPGIPVFHVLQCSMYTVAGKILVTFTISIFAAQCGAISLGNEAP